MKRAHLTQTAHLLFHHSTLFAKPLVLFVLYRHDQRVLASVSDGRRCCRLRGSRSTASTYSLLQTRLQLLLDAQQVLLVLSLRAISVDLGIPLQEPTWDSSSWTRAISPSASLRIDLTLSSALVASACDVSKDHRVNCLVIESYSHGSPEISSAPYRGL